jgi:hypothetical protein
MSVSATAWCWEHSRAEGSALLLLLALADRANDEGDDIWPSQKTLARKCRISVRTVHRLLGELEELGEVKIERYAGVAIDGQAGRHTHRYSLPRFADSLSDNPGDNSEVVGQDDRQSGGGCRTSATGCRTNQVGLSDTAMSEKTSYTSLDTSARSSNPQASSPNGLAERLYLGLKDKNPKVSMGECVSLVEQIRNANVADHRIDEVIGMALQKGAQWPSYVEKLARGRLPEMATS